MDKQVLSGLLKLGAVRSSSDETLLVKRNKMQLIYLLEWTIIGIGGLFYVGFGIVWSGGSILSFLYGILFLGIMIFFIIIHSLMFRLFIKSTGIRIFNILNLGFLLRNLFLLIGLVMGGGEYHLLIYLTYYFYWSLVIAVINIPLGILVLLDLKNVNNYIETNSNQLNE